MEQDDLVKLIRENFSIHELSAILNNGISIEKTKPGLPYMKVSRSAVDRSLNLFVIMYSYGAMTLVDYIESYHFDL